MQLEKSLRAWGTPDFKDVLKQEIAQHASKLPLQQGLSVGNHALDAPITVAINQVTELENAIRVSVGIFFQSVIAGCSCADDPTSTSEINEYCEVHLDINKTTAATAVTLAE